MELAKRSSILPGAMVAQHIPRYYDLDCSACGQPWPCEPAKVHMLSWADGNYARLLVWLAKVYHDCADHHPADSKIYTRLLGWVPKQGGRRARRADAPDPVHAEE